MARLYRRPPSYIPHSSCCNPCHAELPCEDLKPDPLLELSRLLPVPEEQVGDLTRLSQLLQILNNGNNPDSIADQMQVLMRALNTAPDNKEKDFGHLESAMMKSSLASQLQAYIQQMNPYKPDQSVSGISTMLPALLSGMNGGQDNIMNLLLPMLTSQGGGNDAMTSMLPLLLSGMGGGQGNMMSAMLPMLLSGMSKKRHEKASPAQEVEEKEEKKADAAVKPEEPSNPKQTRPKRYR